MNEMFEALVKDIQRVEASARKMGRYLDKEYDRVTLSYALVHLEDARRVLEEHMK